MFVNKYIQNKTMLLYFGSYKLQILFLEKNVSCDQLEFVVFCRTSIYYVSGSGIRFRFQSIYSLRQF